MQLGNPAIYKCEGKNTDRGMHCWEFNDKGIATCTFCHTELSEEDSLDLNRTNTRWKRELKQLRDKIKERSTNKDEPFF